MESDENSPAHRETPAWLTLIICGREDEVTPPDQSEFMNEAIKGSILKVIDKAGHVSNLEQPDEFNQYLPDFLTTWAFLIK